MVQKKFIKSRKVYKVTFSVPVEELPEDLEIETLAVVGDFNDWDDTAAPMKKLKKGVYKATVEFEPGQDVQFRYRANGEHWINDWEADDYVPNEFGSDNCVVTIPEMEE